MSLKKVIRVKLLDKRITQPERGWLIQLFPLLSETLGTLEDIHIVTFEPGVIRGNHYHELMTEAVLPLTSGMRIGWIDETGRHEEITTAGEILYKIPPRVPHALRNDNDTAAIAIAFGDRPFDSNAPDRFPHPIF